MQVVERFLNVPLPTQQSTIAAPGCPRLPVPPLRDPATSQQRWDDCHQRRTEEADMLTVAEISAMTRWTESTLLGLIETGRAIALVDAAGEFRLPFWQFFDPVWTSLPQIQAVLGSPSSSCLLRFLEETADELWCMLPRTAVERGHLSHVLSYAAWKQA